MFEIFNTDICIQVSMFRTMWGPLRVKNMVLLLIGIIYVGASKREDPIQELKVIADAGPIKEQPLRDRETNGINKTAIASN